MSEPVVTVFKLLGRAEHQTYDKRTNEWKADLLIQPMMEAPDGDDKRMATGLAKKEPVVQPAMAAAQPGQKEG